MTSEGWPPQSPLSITKMYIRENITYITYFKSFDGNLSLWALATKKNIKQQARDSYGMHILKEKKTEALCPAVYTYTTI